MQNLDFFYSLHRPFHQQLKTTRWVCLFIKQQKNPIKSTSLNIEFYLFILKKLNKEYDKFGADDFVGLPSKEAISSVVSFFRNKTKKTCINEIQIILRKERESQVEKQIYSTYKAASYYVNMAKDKFKLIGFENTLTDLGLDLLSIKSGFITYTTKEKVFFYKRILRNDFLIFVSLCLFKKIEKKYNHPRYIDSYFDFLVKFYNIKIFQFTKSSLQNYNTVRNYWIEKLEILDYNMNIKKNFLDLILNDVQYNQHYFELKKNIDVYTNNTFKYERTYLKHKKNFEIAYYKNISLGKSDLGYVNLYDINIIMKLPFESFQKFINDYYEKEKGTSYIFFSNIVSSVDRRRRFDVKGVSVLKIKIKK